MLSRYLPDDLAHIKDASVLPLPQGKKPDLPILYPSDISSDPFGKFPRPVFAEPAFPEPSFAEPVEIPVAKPIAMPTPRPIVKPAPKPWSMPLASNVTRPLSRWMLPALSRLRALLEYVSRFENAVPIVAITAMVVCLVYMRRRKVIKEEQESEEFVTPFHSPLTSRLTIL